MSTFAADTFNGITNGSDLNGRTATDGGTWTEHPNVNSGALAGQTDRIRNNNGGSGNRSLQYHSADPGGGTPADYDVQADIVVNDTTNESFMGVAGRIATGAATYYWARYRGSNTTMNLYVVSAGVQTTLGGTGTNVPAVSFTLKLEMRGTTIKAFAGATEILSATDSAISAAGKSGVVSEGFAVGATNGQHIDNFAGIDLAAGGTTYNETVDETLTAAAILSAAGILVGAQSETLPASDSQTSAATLQAELTEALSASDTQASAATLAAALSEVLTAAESQAGQLTTASAQPESLSAVDASDAEVFSGGVFNETMGESLSVSDSATGLLVAVGAQPETLAAADAQESSATLAAVIAELLSTTDSAAASIQGIAAVLETLAATDTASAPDGEPATDAVRWARIEEGPAITLLVREGPALRLIVRAYTEDGSMAWHPDNTNHIEVEPRSEADRGAKVLGATVTALIEKNGTPITGLAANPMVLTEGTGRRAGIYFGAASKDAAIAIGDSLTADIIVDDGADRYAAGTLTIPVTARVLTAV